MHVDAVDALGPEAEAAARAVHVHLTDLAVAPAPAAAAAGAGGLDRPSFGDSYVYDTSAVADMACAAVERSWHALRDPTHAYDGGDGDERAIEAALATLGAWVRLWDRVLTLNMRWSLADAQTRLLTQWKVFLQVYVLPGSSARQVQCILHVVKRKVSPSPWAAPSPTTPFSTSPVQAAFLRTLGDDEAATMPLRANRSDSDASSGAGTPGGGGTSGAMSPDVSNASPTAARKSRFAGDKRSYELVMELAGHLMDAVGAGQTAAGAGAGAAAGGASSRARVGAGGAGHDEGRLVTFVASLPDARPGGGPDVPAPVLGYGAVHVLAEKTELLVSMLHHQVLYCVQP
jgi:hypothetical protein